MNLHACVNFGPDRSSGLRQDRRARLRLVRLLASALADSRKNPTKKQKHLYIKNYNSGLTMLTLTSLTFFSAIFIALGGALALEAS